MRTYATTSRCAGISCPVCRSLLSPCPIGNCTSMTYLVSSLHAPCNVSVQEQSIPWPWPRWSVRHPSPLFHGPSLIHRPRQQAETTNFEDGTLQLGCRQAFGMGLETTTTTCQRKVAAIAVPCGVTLSCRFVHVSTYMYSDSALLPGGPSDNVCRSTLGNIQVEAVTRRP
jgi:hypothetical protein